MQYLDCRVDYLGVDLLSLSGHKIYAPKGVGVLYKRSGVPLIKQMDGGGQEMKIRAGTENVPAVIGLGKALEVILKPQERDTAHLWQLRGQLVEEILKIPGVELTSPIKDCAPHIASFIIGGVEGEAMVLLLSQKKIIISTGSACNSSELQPSHVLTAMGYPPEKSHGSIRFSLGRDTSEEDIRYVAKIVPEVVSQLRRMSPFG